MLAVKYYASDYIQKCKSKIEAEVSVYQKLISSINNDEVLTVFEHRYFNNLVLILDRIFVHRMKGQEGKDGNPLNEVRVLCDSIIDYNGMLTKDKTIKLDPEKSILKYQVGDQIKLTMKEFEQLSDAFFEEIHKKFQRK